MAHPFPQCARAGWFVAVLAAIGSLNASIAIAQSATGATPNLALGRPYTLTPRPNYALTTDADDDRQLTDGLYTAWNPIWLRTSTVGWQNAPVVTITIDLQSVQPIAGVSFRTSAGRAGVQWPRSIFVLVSEDNQHFFPAGDLTAIQAGAAPPPAEGYLAYRFARTDFRTHGRYVTLMVDATGPYVFSDEIEVQAGDQSWLDRPLDGASTTNLQDYLVRARQSASIQRRLTLDLSAARGALAASSADAGLRAALTAELNDIEAGIARQPSMEPGDFVAILPIGDLHARIFAVQGRLAQAAGWPDLSLWAANPWEFVRMLDKPPADASRELSITAMNGETRSGAVSISNSSGQAMRLSLHFSEPAPDAAADLRLYEVVWTDTHELIPVADALVPLPAADATIDLPAGVTRQIWISFSPRNRAAGEYQVFLDATETDGSAVRATVSLKVLAAQFPSRATLHLGGWDYTDKDGFLGLPPDTASSFIQTLRDLNVDSPWATAAVMPATNFDSSGHLERSPDTTRFDGWMAKWPDAASYFVFLNVGDTLGNVRTSEGPRFVAAVGEWITFWVTHAASLGVRPSQLSLLLVDEPTSATQDARIAVWGRAIKAAQPQITIWEDPNFRDPASGPWQSLDVSDEVALERSLIDELGAPFLDFYRERSQAGQRLAIYGAAGPARLLDPHTYYRLQPWLCAWLGAGTSFFWSFTDDAKGRSWNDYVTDRASYSPFFISTKEITRSRHSEALREGVEDFEYLAMLRRRLETSTDGVTNELAAQAADVLQTAVADVLSAAGPSNTLWTADADRSAAERVRLRIGELLERLPERAPDPVYVTLTGGSFVYDGAPHRATAIAVDASGGPVPGPLSIDYVPGGAIAPVHAGTYVVTATFPGMQGRFQEASAAGTVVIAQATPSVAVGGHAPYDGHEHAAAVTVAGIDGMPVPGTMTLIYTPGGSAAPTDPGSYAVAARFVSAEPDYRDAAAAGSFTIDWPLVAVLTYPPDRATNVQLPVPFQWTAVHAVDRYYLYVGSTPGAKDLVNTGEISATSYKAATLPRGRTLYVRLWTKTGGVWRYADSRFSIPAPTTVSVENRSFVFDGQGHAATASATDPAGASVPGSFRLSYEPGGATPPVGGGTYAVTALFTSADPRFEDAQGAGIIVIDPAAPQLAVAAERVVFDGNPHRASATAVGIDGTPIAGTFAFAYAPGDVPRDAGDYGVTATFTSGDPNYTNGTAAGSIAIVPAVPALSVVSGPFVFDRSSHLATASIVDRNGTPIAGTVTVTYTPGGASAPVNAGTYAIIIQFSSADANYANAEGAATLAVVPATPRVVVTDRTFSYDGQSHGTTAKVTGLDGLPLSGTLTLTYAPGGAALPVNAGVYTVAAAFASGDPNYTSAGATGSVAIQTVPLVATLTYPADGATNVDLSIPLQWTAVDRPDTYYLYVGSSRGAKDLVNTGETGATSYRISSLLRGETVFVRLWTKVQGVWRYSDSTFTAARLIATLTYPPPSATRVDLSRALQWTPVDGVQVYYVYVGTTPGAKDVVNSGEITGTSLLARWMPPNQLLYVRLWTKAGGIWRYSDSTLTAAPPVEFD